MDTEEQEFVCEVCGRTETMTNGEAYANGWDYPPFMGVFGIVSPRTCGKCPIDKTVWWALVAEHKVFEDLSETQRETIQRIRAEDEKSKTD